MNLRFFYINHYVEELNFLKHSRSTYGTFKMNSGDQNSGPAINKSQYLLLEYEWGLVITSVSTIFPAALFFPWSLNTNAISFFPFSANSFPWWSLSVSRPQPIEWYYSNEKNLHLFIILVEFLLWNSHLGPGMQWRIHLVGANI